MNSRAVDTCVFSYIYRGDSRAESYKKHLDGKNVYLSFMTVAELYRWAIVRKWSAARIRQLTDRIGEFSFLECDDETMWIWAELMNIKGVPMNPSDAWIATSAKRHGFPLVTHNPSDFEHVPGLIVISEA